MYSSKARLCPRRSSFTAGVGERKSLPGFLMKPEQVGPAGPLPGKPRAPGEGLSPSNAQPQLCTAPPLVPQAVLGLLVMPSCSPCLPRAPNRPGPEMEQKHEAPHGPRMGLGCRL